MEAFTDAVGLWALGLGARVIDVLDRQVEFVFVPLGIAAVFAAAVVNIRVSLTSWPSNNGITRSLTRSAAVIGILRS